MPVRGEARDVVARPSGEDETDRWDKARRYAASAKDDVDERAPRTAVAVDERVNRLELSVCDRCLVSGTVRTR